jgi:iron complex transport system substrate-binding protein
MRSTESRSCSPARSWLLVTLLLLAVACGAEPQAGSAGAGDPAETDTAETRTAEAEEPALTDNRTDGCVTDPDPDADLFPDKIAFEHADGVAVSYEGTYKVVEVTPPQVPGAEPVRYVLLQCGAPEPDLGGDLAEAQVLEVPVERLASMTATNLPHLDELDALDRLVGVGDLDYIVTEGVLERADDLDELADETGVPVMERLLDTAPDLLVIDGFGDAILDDVARYVEAGVPTVVNADFNEQTMLGRAEWVKLTGLLLNEERRATEVFDEVEERYAELSARAAAAADAGKRPKVLVNAPFEGTWFAPGGASFLAGAISDAGGTYAFTDDASTGSLQLDIETVLDRASDADVWIQAGSVHGTLDDLLAADERFAQLRAFNDGEVWAYDRWTTPTGGHAVLETAYLRADWFLADLMAIFHPDELPDHDFTFFGRVPE